MGAAFFPRRKPSAFRPVTLQQSHFCCTTSSSQRKWRTAANLALFSTHFPRCSRLRQTPLFRQPVMPFGPLVEQDPRPPLSPAISAFRSREILASGPFGSNRSGRSGSLYCSLPSRRPQTTISSDAVAAEQGSGATRMLARSEASRDAGSEACAAASAGTAKQRRNGGFLT